MQLVFTVVMSRLLTPQDFGLFAAAIIVVNLARQFGQLGLGHALVQRPDLTHEQIHSVFTVSFFVTTVLGVAVAAGAQVIATALGEPKAAPVLTGLAPDFLLAGAAVAWLSLLRRELRFKELSVIEMAASILGYLIVGIGAGVLGAGVASLVLAILTYDSVTLVGSALASRKPMRFSLRMAAFTPLISYGGTLSIIGVLEYIHATLDTLALARYSGSVQLGQYNRSMTLVTVPFTRISSGIARILFPTFSSLQDSPRRMAPGYRLAFMTIGGVLGPVGGAVAAAADELVLVLLGNGWELAAALLPLATFIVVANTLAQFAAIVADAAGVLRARLIIQSSALALLILLIVLTASRGIFWILSSVTLVALLRLVAYTHLATRILQLRRHWINVLRVVFSVAAAYGSVAIVLFFIPSRHLVLSLLASFAATFVAMLLLWIVGPFASTRKDLVNRIVPTLRSDRLRRILEYCGGSTQLGDRHT